MAVAGKVAITLSTVNDGKWIANETYERLVAVTHNNNLYISRKPSTNVEPPNNEFWFLALEGFSGTEVEDIINGTTQVGNAKTLDGHEAEYFLPKSGGTIEAAGAQPLKVKNTESNLCFIPFIGVDGELGYLGFDGANPCVILQNEEIKKLLHSGNIGDYALPLTGGYINGDLRLWSNGEEYRTFRLRNSKRDILVRIVSNGAFQIVDNSTSTVLADSVAGGKLNIDGTATGNLPLTGGTISNKLDTLLVLNNATGGAVSAFLGYKADGAVLGYIGFKNGFPYVTYPDNFGYIIHTGNYKNYAADVENGTFDLKMDNVALGAGTYYKVGKMVYCYANGSLPITQAGYKYLTGLPFTVKSLNGSFADFHSHQYYGTSDGNRVFEITSSSIVLNFKTSTTSELPYTFSAFYIAE